MVCPGRRHPFLAPSPRALTAGLGSQCVWCVSLSIFRLFLAAVWLGVWVSPAGAISLSARTDRLIDRLQQLDVLTHEAIHVVQDCLDGLETPSSSTISLMLQSQGGFSSAQVDKFFAHHLDPSTADHVLKVTQTLGPLQRRREVEAYSLQSQTGMVESLLARHC